MAKKVVAVVKLAGASGKGEPLSARGTCPWAAWDQYHGVLQDL